MKKIIAAIAACLMITAALAGCGSSNPLGDAENKQAATQSTEAATEIKAENYSADFNGLVEYLHALGYIPEDYFKKENKNEPIKADYKAIGAEQGYKYVNGASVIELYEFKTDSKKVLESVKKNGTFELYNKTIKGYLSADEKFMMIFDNATIKEDDTSSDAYKMREGLAKAVASFGK